MSYCIFMTQPLFFCFSQLWFVHNFRWCVEIYCPWYIKGAFCWWDCCLIWKWWLGTIAIQVMDKSHSISLYYPQNVRSNFDLLNLGSSPNLEYISLKDIWVPEFNWIHTQMEVGKLRWPFAYIIASPLPKTFRLLMMHTQMNYPCYYLEISAFFSIK